MLLYLCRVPKVYSQAIGPDGRLGRNEDEIGLRLGPQGALIKVVVFR